MRPIVHLRRAKYGHPVAIFVDRIVFWNEFEDKNGDMQTIIQTDLNSDHCGVFVQETYDQVTAAIMRACLDSDKIKKVKNAA